VKVLGYGQNDLGLGVGTKTLPGGRRIDAGQIDRRRREIARLATVVPSC
jgi:hypothetical protein